jgi:heat shock protein HslJ
LPSDSGIAFPQDFAVTMMACHDEIEAFERRFINALVRASDYVRYGMGLVKMDATGNALLHFEERPE